jgi:hypothetical protein
VNVCPVEGAKPLSLGEPFDTLKLTALAALPAGALAEIARGLSHDLLLGII